MSKSKKILALALAVSMMATMMLAGCGKKPSTPAASSTSTSTSTSGEEAKGPVIGISWKSVNVNDPGVVASYEGYATAIEKAGGVAVRLDQVTSSAVKYSEDGTIEESYVDENGMLLQEYADTIKACKFDETNVAEVMDGIDGVFFCGGEDISPSLFKTPVPAANHGEEINATRDISDYTLMAYCIEKDIPVFAACRGEQMMGIVSGVTFIQDITDYYASKGVEYAETAETHRMAPGMENRTYARHEITVLDGSKWLGDIVGSNKLENVSSWHHQAIESVEGTELTLVATANLGGVEIVEGIERQDKTFCLGLQFHPENDLALAYYKNEPDSAKCDLDICLNVFEALVAAASK